MKRSRVNTRKLCIYIPVPITAGMEKLLEKRLEANPYGQSLGRLFAEAATSLLEREGIALDPEVPLRLPPGKVRRGKRETLKAGA